MIPSSQNHDLTSISETLEEVVEMGRTFEEKIKRRSSRYSIGDVPVIDERAKLAVWRKALYGFGNFSRYTVIGIQAYFLNVFLLEVAGLSPGWAGTILLVKNLYDGVTDPLIGRLSDRIQTRWGRRKPWIVVGTIPSGIFWVLQWYSPKFTEDRVGLAVLYFTVVLLAFSTMNTFVSVPYNAMVPDVAVDYDDRTAVVLFQELFGLSAVIIFSFFQAETVEFFRDEDGIINYRKGYAVAGLVTVWAVIIPMILAILPVSERKNVTKDDEEYGDRSVIAKALLWVLYFIKSLIKALMFKEFFLIVVVFVGCMIAIYIFVNNFVLYLKYVLHIEDQTSYLMLIVQVTCTGSIIFWGLLCKKIGKKLTFFIGCTFWIGGSIIIFFISDDNIKLFYLIAFFRAAGSGVGYLIPLAMLPDIIELDFLKNRLKREGILYSLMILIQKTGVGFALTASNYVLGWVGYVKPEKQTTSEQVDDYQSDSVIMAFRILLCIVPIFCILISLIAIYFIKVDRETLEKAGDPLFKPKR